MRRSRFGSFCRVSLFPLTLLFAADIWQSKPFTEWTDKDRDKLISDSPWARPYTVLVSHEMPATSSGRATGAQADDRVPTVARRSSALPTREVMARLKYKTAAGTSAEAKAILETVPAVHTIEISGAFAIALAATSRRCRPPSESYDPFHETDYRRARPSRRRHSRPKLE